MWRRLRGHGAAGSGARVVLLCCAWYVSSSGTNVVGKLALGELGLPLTVSMAQLAGTALLGGAALAACGGRGGLCGAVAGGGQAVPRRHLLALAAAKILTTGCSQLSLWRVPVSYAHTVKATTPLWTALLARVLLGERQPGAVGRALVLIALGVVVASLTELQFDRVGLAAALAAAALLSLQHIYTKRLMSHSQVHPLRLLQSVSLAASVLQLPLWLWSDGAALVARPPSAHALLLLAGGAALAWLQAAAAFSVLSLVSPLTYAVASSAKRCVVVVGSLVVLRNPAPPLNLAGMALTLAGVAAYNTAKTRAKAKAPALLPAPALYRHA